MFFLVFFILVFFTCVSSTPSVSPLLPLSLVSTSSASSTAGFSPLSLSLSQLIFVGPPASAMPPQLQPRSQNGPRVLQGDLSALSPAVKEFVETSVSLCQPESIHICDGSDEENQSILTQLEEQGMIKKLSKYENWWVVVLVIRVCSLVRAA